jgi:hypothetical protein
MMIWIAGILLMAYHLGMIATHTILMMERKHNRYGYIVANWVCVTMTAYLLVVALK